MYLRSVITR
jgi:hypothetical protein